MLMWPADLQKSSVRMNVVRFLEYDDDMILYGFREKKMLIEVVLHKMYEISWQNYFSNKLRISF